MGQPAALRLRPYEGFLALMAGWLNLVLAAVLAVVAGAFALANQADVVVSLPGGWILPRVPLFVLAFVPLLIGFFLGVSSGWSGALVCQEEVAVLVGQNIALGEELANLRNQPLSDDISL